MGMAVILRPIKSSNIKAVGYDTAKTVPGYGDLYVQFASGATYRYQAVPTQVHLDFINAQSAGSFFSSYIKNAYPFIKLAQQPEEVEDPKEEVKEEPKETTNVPEENKFEAGTEIKITKYAVKIIGSHTAGDEIIITAKVPVSVEIAALLKALGISHKLDIVK